jgi:hypothetical protein
VAEYPTRTLRRSNHCLKIANGKATHRICSQRLTCVRSCDANYSHIFRVFFVVSTFSFLLLAQPRVFQPGDRHSWVFLVDKAPGARDRFVSRIFSSCRLYFWASINSEVKARNTKTQLPPDSIPCGFFSPPL